MFTTKLTSIPGAFYTTESPYLKTLMDVYIRKSRLSMEIKVCLGIAAPNESVFEKLCELPEYIKIIQERVAPDTLVSGTLRRPETSHYHCPPKLTWNLEYAESDVAELLEKCRKWHTENINSRQQFYEQYFCDFSGLETRILGEQHLEIIKGRPADAYYRYHLDYSLLQRPASVCSKEISKI